MRHWFFRYYWLLVLASQAHAGDPWHYCTPYWEERCGGITAQEPKDVSCMLSHDCVQEPDLAGYRWYLTSPRTLCGETHTAKTTKANGSQALDYARPKFNPYRFDGACFPRLGESRTYVVRAVDEAGEESLNDSNPYTVIGTSICCANSTGWVACWPGAAPCSFGPQHLTDSLIPVDTPGINDLVYRGPLPATPVWDDLIYRGPVDLEPCGPPQAGAAPCRACP